MIDASVIIPTYNRWESLISLFDDLDAQRTGSYGFEVVVVDDGSTDGHCPIPPNRYHFPMQLLRQKNQGSAVARNTGAAAARGQILIFLDDDIGLEPDYVRLLINLHKRRPKTVGMGAFHPWTPPQPTVFNQVYAERMASPKTDAAETVFSFDECVTNNLSIECEDFFSLGQMQDIGGDGPTWWGDVDFGYRARQAGFSFWRANQAVCYHHDYAIRDLPTAAARAEKAARMAIQLFHKYPELECCLPMFDDKLPINLHVDSPHRILRKLIRGAGASLPALALLVFCARQLERTYPSYSKVLTRFYIWIIGAWHWRGVRCGLAQYGAPAQSKASLQA